MNSQTHDARRVKNLALIVLFYLLCYLVPLGVRDLTIPDETRYGEIPREMLAGYGWGSPHLNGARYFEKPILGYWLHAASIAALGENNFAVRFPSVLGVGLSAFALYFFLRYAMRQTSKRQGESASADIAESSAMIFLSSFGIYGIGNMAVLDNIFSFFVTATMILFYISTNLGRSDPRRLAFGVLSGFFCGAAFLTKGFVALVIPAVTFVPYLLWTQEIRGLPRLCLAPLAAFFLTILPWSILIHLREPDFWRFFFWNEHIRRFMSENAQNARSFWFFFAVGPLLAFPWAFFFPAASVGIVSILRNDEMGGRIVKFCVCWLVFPFLFFSVARGKLMTYILPCFPPFAVLCAFGLLKPVRGGGLLERRNALLRFGLYANLTFFALGAAVALYLQFFKTQEFVLYSHISKVIMIPNGFLFFALFCMWALKAPYPARKVWYVALSPFMLFVTIHFLVPDATIEMKMPGRFLTSQAENVKADTVIVTDDDTVGAVCWYFKREDVYLLEGAGELSYGFDYENAKRHINAKQFAELVRSHPRNVLLIAGAKKIDRLKEELPRNFIDERRSDFSGYLVLRKY